MNKPSKIHDLIDEPELVDRIINSPESFPLNEGVYFRNLRDDYYRLNLRFANFSLLKEIDKSPAHAFLEKKQTPAMKFGSFVHELILTENRFPFESFSPNFMSAKILEDDAFFEKQKVKYKKDRADFALSYYQKEIISEDYWEAGFKIRDAIDNNDLAKGLMKDADFEIAVYRHLNGFDFKGKADILGGDYVADLKTSSDFLANDFSKSIWAYKYHVQAALYCALFNKPNFYWIVAEKTEPYSVAVYKASPEMLDRGYQDLDRLLVKWQGWLDNKDQLAFKQNQIEEINLPSWVY